MQGTFSSKSKPFVLYDSKSLTISAQMLQFYEDNLRWRQVDQDEASPSV